MDKRTNSYTLTEEGENSIEERLEWESQHRDNEGNADSEEITA